MSKYTLEISGDFACFTRPEMKVERVSYDVITPSAARAIFEAILWKPAMRWHIKRIEILNPIRWVNIRRNEVDSVISTKNINTVMNGGNAGLQILIEDDRQQRAGLFLRDVAYRIHAGFSLQDDNKHVHRFPDLRCADTKTVENTCAKFSEMFKRRARKGQCFNQPYLGTREFSCSFRLIEQEELEKEQSTHPAISDDKELGWMLYDMDFTDPNNPSPRFFNANIVSGEVTVPDQNSEEIKG
ncbi:MAG: type I-C CRISPR-associated protein Cas5c [Gammaproteobacteria bacterium]|nr:type I-C CRISPR-associated protein Cas5c [Gammaproteobacteria bacterium]